MSKKRSAVDARTADALHRAVHDLAQRHPELVRIVVAGVPYPAARTPKMSAEDRSALGSATLHARTLKRVTRTRELTDEGRTNAQIGRIIADEEGQAAPFPARTVSGWRNRRI